MKNEYLNSNGMPLTKEEFIEKIKKDDQFYNMFKIPFKSVNIKYLVDNGVQIWCKEAYRWYQEKYEFQDNLIDTPQLFLSSIDEFLIAVKNKELCPIHDYEYGDLGKVYGYQWRNQNGVDQVRDVIEGLKNNPFSRYHIINAWNAADFKDMALPPCHLLYQFIVRPLTFDQRHNVYKERNNGMILNFDSIERITHALDDFDIPKFYLDLNMYQRSCDAACGIPFNLASMSLLLMIFAKTCNMIPGVSTWIGGDTHIYTPHVETVKEQIKRTPYKLPTIKILKDIKTLNDILALTINDFELIDYKSHDKINYELFVGLKK